MSRAAFVPNALQDAVIRELVVSIKSKLRSGTGGWIYVHGETLSGLTTMLHRLCDNRRFGLMSPWLIAMTPLPHLSGVKASLLHGMRLPDESANWPNSSVVPRFLSDYLSYSQTRIALVDDIHLVETLSKAEQQRFRNLIQELTKPPYSLVFVFSGNFARFQPRFLGWPGFDTQSLIIMKRFKSVKQVWQFSNAILDKRDLDGMHSHTCPLVSYDYAKQVLGLTRGHIGEIVNFLSMLARECHSDWRDISGNDAFSRVSRRYRARND